MFKFFFVQVDFVEVLFLFRRLGKGWVFDKCGLKVGMWDMSDVLIEIGMCSIGVVIKFYIEFVLLVVFFFGVLLGFFYVMIGVILVM